MSDDFRVLPVVFETPGRFGDFFWMAEQPEFSRTLFVFNDNEDQFVAFEQGRPSGIERGGGNAGIRPWRGESPPRAAGIPTGDRDRGYRVVDDRVLGVLERALGIVHDLVDTGRYDTLVFSRDKDRELLGVNIFSPHDDYCRLVYQALSAVRPGGPRWRPGGTGLGRP